MRFSLWILFFIPIISSFQVDFFQNFNQYRIDCTKSVSIFNAIDGLDNYDLIPSYRLKTGSNVSKVLMDMPKCFFTSSTRTNIARLPFRKRWLVFIPVEYKNSKSILCIDGSNHGNNHIVIRLFNRENCINTCILNIAQPSHSEKINNLYHLINDVFNGRNIRILFHDFHKYLYVMEEENKSYFLDIEI